MTETKKYRVKDNPKSVYGGSHGRFSGGEEIVFKPYLDNAGQEQIVNDGGVFMAGGGYLISSTQLEPVNDFEVIETGYQDGIYTIANNGNVGSYLPSRFQVARDKAEYHRKSSEKYAETARAYDYLADWLEKKNTDDIAVDAKQVERQKYIDALSGVLAPEAAGALYDAGFNLPKKD